LKHMSSLTGRYSAVSVRLHCCLSALPSCKELAVAKAGTCPLLDLNITLKTYNDPGQKERVRIHAP
jgi:hypothetical protein